MHLVSVHLDVGWGRRAGNAELHNTSSLLRGRERGGERDRFLLMRIKGVRPTRYRNAKGNVI